MQALYDVTGQAVGEGADFKYSLYFAAFEAHTASHYEADVARTQNNDFVTGQIAFHIYHTLCSACSEYASRTFTRSTDSATSTFTAAHGQNNGFAFKFQQTFFRANCDNGFIRFNFENHGINQGFDFRFVFNHFDATISIARTGQFFFEVMQAKAVVDALLQDAAKFAVTFDNDNLFSAIFPCAVSSRKTSRAAANNNYII